MQYNLLEMVLDKPASIITLRADFERYKISEYGVFTTKYPRYYIGGDADTLARFNESMSREIPIHHRYQPYSNGGTFDEYPKVDEIENNPSQYRIIFLGTMKPPAK